MDPWTIGPVFCGGRVAGCLYTFFQSTVLAAFMMGEMDKPESEDATKGEIWELEGVQQEGVKPVLNSE